MEHDQSLHKLLVRLEVKKLTLNGDKCTVGMGNVVSMSILLSKHGIGPTEEKVRAMKEATLPSSASEVGRSEPPPSPELTDQTTQETTPTGLANAYTPRRSGRISQPLKALADYVLY